MKCTLLEHGSSSYSNWLEAQAPRAFYGVGASRRHPMSGPQQDDDPACKLPRRLSLVEPSLRLICGFTSQTLNPQPSCVESYHGKWLGEQRTALRAAVSLDEPRFSSGVRPSMMDEWAFTARGVWIL